MCCMIESRGQGAKTVPLWVRVLEIETPALGSQHPQTVKYEGVLMAITAPLGSEMH